MLINLQVTFSSKIETKHPWQKIFWLGKDKENLILQRSNILKKFNPDTGKTRKILSQLVKNCLALNYSKNGNYIIGLQSDGNLFKWYKDADVINYICGDDVNFNYLCNYKQENGTSRKITVDGNESGNKIALIDFYDSKLSIYLWKATNEDLPLQLTGPQLTANQFPEIGRWLTIEEINNSFPVLPSNCRSLCWDFSFSNSVKQNVNTTDFCQGAFVYNLQKFLKVYVLQVHFDKLRDNVGLLPTYFWKCVTIPFEKLDSTIHSVEESRKMFLTRWSHSGNMLVISTNVKHSAVRDYIIFASKCLGKISISSLPEEFSLKRHYHSICDMTWTNDDLFVVVINRLGSICLISRFGDPLTIATYGYSMDLAPAKFLNIHPLIFVKKRIQGSFESDDTSRASSESVELLHQKFSISAHPRSSYIICSDGYIVTCFRLPKETENAYSFVKIYLKHLRKLRKAFKKASSVCEIEDESNDSLPLTNVGTAEFVNKDSKRFSLADFSPANSDDDSSRLDPRVLRSSLIGDFDCGTIILGSHSYRNVAGNSKKTVPDDSKIIARCMLSIWGIMSTVNSEWTSEWEVCCSNASDQLFKFILHLLKVSSTYDRFTEIILLIKNWLAVCCGGVSQKHLLVSLHQTFKQIFLTILKYPLGKSFDVFYENCADLLQFAENQTSSFYIDDFSSHGKPTPNRFLSIWCVLFQRAKRCNIDNDSLKRLMDLRMIPVKRCPQLVKCNGKMVSGCRLLLMAPKKWQTVTINWESDIESLLKCEISPITTKKVSHLLHAVLYTLLLNYQPKEIIKFIFWLFEKINNNCAHHLVINRAIASFTSILSHFVLGENFSVFPYHLPHTYRMKLNRFNRLIKISNNKLKEEIDKHPTLVKHWTPDVAIALSLYLKDFNKASHLAYRFGDWKMSILIKYAQNLNFKHDLCTENIDDILNNRIVMTVNEQNTLNKYDYIFCKDLFTAGVFCGFDIFYTTLNHLFASVKNAIFVRDFSVIVPDFIHLPRPPFYCPQLNEQCEESAVLEDVEENWAENVSMAVRKLANIFRTGNCLLSSAFSYLNYLRNKIGEVMRIKNASNYLWTLEMMFQRLNSVANISNNDELASSRFRDFCSLCFFLHARDKLNIALRNIRTETENLSYSNRTKSTDKACIDSLSWILHLSPFADEAGWETDLLHAMISTVLEAPTDRRISRLVARLIPDQSIVPPAIKQRFKLISNRWDDVNIRVASNRKHLNRTNNASLSNIFAEQCQEVRDSVRKFESLIGQMEDKICFGGTEWVLRPFEIEEDFFQFLKLFLEITLFQDLSSIEEEDADFILDAPLTVNYRKPIFENQCNFYAPISNFESQSDVFSHRLACDSAELSKCDGCSSQLQSCNNCNANVSSRNQAAYKFKANRSCLQYVSDLEMSDFKFNDCEHEEQQKIIVWLVKWSKREKRVLPNLHQDFNGQINCNLTFRQIWKAIHHINQSSSIEKIKEETLNEENAHVDETTDIFEETLQENEVEKSEIFNQVNSDRLINSSESIGIDLDSLNREADITSNFFPSTKRWDWTNDFGLDAGSINRESDEETIASITSDWTLDVDDIDNTNELAVKKSESLDIDLSRDKNSLAYSELILPQIGDPDNDTFDDISTSKEFGVNDSYDLLPVHSPENESSPPFPPNLIQSPKNSIPPLLKFDESTSFRFIKNSIKERRFLSKDDLEQLTSKWINQTSDKIKENLQPKLEPLIILKLPKEQPESIKVGNEYRLVVANTSTKAVQTQKILAKDSSSNTSKKFTSFTRRNRNMTIEVMSPIDIKPNAEIELSNAPKTLVNKVSFATQTNTFEVPLKLSTPSTPENANSPGLNAINSPDQAPTHSEKIAISNSKLDLTLPSTCNQTIDEIDYDENFNSSASNVTSPTLDILQFKDRLKQLEDEGFLALSNPSEVFKVPVSLNQQEANNPNKSLDSDYQSVSGWESVKLRENINSPEKSINREFTLTSMDKISKRSETNRLKLHSKHFEKRKDDALKFINDMLVDPHCPTYYKKNLDYSKAPKMADTSNQNFEKSVRFDNAESSFISTSEDTLSPWVVPEEVSKILYGNSKRLSKTYDARSKHCADILDSFSEGSSDDSLFKDVE